MHKLMLMSATYRQSTRASKDATEKDPDNELLSRQNRRRLEGEAVRDSLLAVSGKLNPKMGGPGVVLPELSKPAGGSKPVPVTTRREGVRSPQHLPLLAAQPALCVPGGVRPARQQPELPQAREEHHRAAGAGAPELAGGHRGREGACRARREGGDDRESSASTAPTASPSAARRPRRSRNAQLRSSRIRRSANCAGRW